MVKCVQGYLQDFQAANCQLGEPCSALCCLAAGDKTPVNPAATSVTDVPGATAGHCASLIYSSSALVIKGCEGDPREREFVQKECLWKGIYLWFSAAGLCTTPLRREEGREGVVGGFRQRRKTAGSSETDVQERKTRFNKGILRFSRGISRKSLVGFTNLNDLIIFVPTAKNTFCSHYAVLMLQLQICS